MGCGGSCGCAGTCGDGGTAVELRNGPGGTPTAGARSVGQVAAGTDGARAEGSPQVVDAGAGDGFRAPDPPPPASPVFPFGTNPSIGHGPVVAPLQLSNWRYVCVCVCWCESPPLPGQITPRPDNDGGPGPPPGPAPGGGGPPPTTPSGGGAPGSNGGEPPSEPPGDAGPGPVSGGEAQSESVATIADSPGSNTGWRPPAPPPYPPPPKPGGGGGGAWKNAAGVGSSNLEHAGFWDEPSDSPEFWIAPGQAGIVPLPLTALLRVPSSPKPDEELPQLDPDAIVPIHDAVPPAPPRDDYRGGRVRESEVELRRAAPDALRRSFALEPLTASWTKSPPHAGGAPGPVATDARDAGVGLLEADPYDTGDLAAGWVDEPGLEYEEYPETGLGATVLGAPHVARGASFGTGPSGDAGAHADSIRWARQFQVATPQDHSGAEPGSTLAVPDFATDPSFESLGGSVGPTPPGLRPAGSAAPARAQLGSTVSGRSGEPDASAEPAGGARHSGVALPGAARSVSLSDGASLGPPSIAKAGIAGVARRMESHSPRPANMGGGRGRSSGVSASDAGASLVAFRTLAMSANRLNQQHSVMNYDALLNAASDASSASAPEIASLSTVIASRTATIEKYKQQLSTDPKDWPEGAIGTPEQIRGWIKDHEESNRQDRERIDKLQKTADDAWAALGDEMGAVALAAAQADAARQAERQFEEQLAALTKAHGGNEERARHNIDKQIERDARRAERQERRDDARRARSSSYDVIKAGREARGERHGIRAAANALQAAATRMRGAKDREAAAANRTAAKESKSLLKTAERADAKARKLAQYGLKARAEKASEQAAAGRRAAGLALTMGTLRANTTAKLKEIDKTVKGKVNRDIAKAEAKNGLAQAELQLAKEKYAADPTGKNKAELDKRTKEAKEAAANLVTAAAKKYADPVPRDPTPWRAPADSDQSPDDGAIDPEPDPVITPPEPPPPPPVNADGKPKFMTSVIPFPECVTAKCDCSCKCRPDQTCRTLNYVVLVPVEPVTPDPVKGRGIPPTGGPVIGDGGAPPASPLQPADTEPGVGDAGRVEPVDAGAEAPLSEEEQAKLDAATAREQQARVEESVRAQVVALMEVYAQLFGPTNSENAVARLHLMRRFQALVTQQILSSAKAEKLRELAAHRDTDERRRVRFTLMADVEAFNAEMAKLAIAWELAGPNERDRRLPLQIDIMPWVHAANAARELDDRLAAAAAEGLPPGPKRQGVERDARRFEYLVYQMDAIQHTLDRGQSPQGLSNLDATRILRRWMEEREETRRSVYEGPTFADMWNTSSGLERVGLAAVAVGAAAAIYLSAGSAASLVGAGSFTGLGTLFTSPIAAILVGGADAVLMNSVFNPSSQSSYSDVAIQFATGAALAGTAEAVGWVVSKGAAKYFAKRAASIQRAARESARGRLATPSGTPKVPDGAAAGVPNAGIVQRTAASERAATRRVAEVTGNTEPPRWLPPDEPRGSGTAARPEGTAVPAPDALHPPELELRFAQRDASAYFSKNPKARFPGETIGSVAEKLRKGVLTPADVPVQYVDIGNGRGLIYDTRSSIALRRAGIPQSDWSLIDASNDARVVEEIKGRLVRNNLPADGIDTITITRPPDPITKQPFPTDVSHLL